MVVEEEKQFFVSIVIPTLNRKEKLLECLYSLQKLDYPKRRMEILVWDNGSQDGTQEAVNSYFSSIRKEDWAGLRLIGGTQNLGHYLHYNEIYKRLQPESTLILGLDDDVELEKACLKKLVQVFHDPGAGIVGARSVFFCEPNRTAGGAGFINPWLGRFYQEDAKTVTECDYVIGCCWLFKKEVIEQVGGFDPDYFVMHWEMDFCTRAKQKGYKVYYQPEAIAKHKIPPQGKRSGIYYLYRNKIMYIRKNSSLLPKMTSYVLYALFWLPKILLSSVIFHKGIHMDEIRRILSGVFHGIIGRTGQWDIKRPSS